MSQQDKEETRILSIVLPLFDDEDHKEEYNCDKTNKKKSRGSGGMIRYMIIAITCLLGFVAIVFILPSDVSSPKERSEFRNVIRPKITKEQTIAATVNHEDEETMTYSKDASYLSDAKKAVANAEEEAFSGSNEYLTDVLKNVEVTMKKAIEQLLEKNRGYSPEKVEEVEKEIIDKLETEVHERLDSEASLVTAGAKQDMDTVFENDVMAKVDSKGIHKDVDAMREYFVEQAHSEVDYATRAIMKDIRDITQGVEKEVISEKLNMDTDSKDLENAELEVQVSEVMTDINNIEKKEFSNIETNLSNKIKKTNENMKIVLRDFLLNEKGLSISEIDKIEGEVSKRIEQEANKNFEDTTEFVEEQVNQAMHIELDGLIEEDKYILDRAKKLGLISPNKIDGDKNKDIELIKNDISVVRDNFDEYLEKLSKEINSDLKISIMDILEDVEKEVLEEEGVEITQNEMDKIIKKENKNRKK